jgi:peroxiredoxin
MLRPTISSFIFVMALAAWSLVPVSAQAFSTGKPAPDISGGPWINSGRLTLNDLKDRVVLVEFWTYGWINCKNVILQLRNWYDKYEKQGFTIVGVHSPEFFWEKSLDKVKAATLELKVRYPVVQDNGFEIWKRYGIWAWPTTVLIDKKGTIRYSHIGEGAYEKTESVIKQLLAEKVL